MLHDVKPPLDEALLMHYGVKGMKWGHRKAQDVEGADRAAKVKQVQKARKAMSKIDADLAYSGLQYRAWGAKKLNKKLRKKDPDFDKRKMSEQEKHDHALHASKIAKRKALLSTARDGAIVAVAGNVALNKYAKSDNVMMQGRLGVASLVATVGKVGYDQVRAINELDKMQSLRRDLHFLETELYGKSEYSIR